MLKFVSVRQVAWSLLLARYGCRQQVSNKEVSGEGSGDENTQAAEKHIKPCLRKRKKNYIKNNYDYISPKEYK